MFAGCTSDSTSTIFARTFSTFTAARHGPSHWDSSDFLCRCPLNIVSMHTIPTVACRGLACADRCIGGTRPAEHPCDWVVPCVGLRGHSARPRHRLVGHESAYSSGSSLSTVFTIVLLTRPGTPLWAHSITHGVTSSNCVACHLPSFPRTLVARAQLRA